MTAIAIQGNAMHLPLPDECVDLVVTSPPYFGLRSYTDDGRPVPDQVGGEPTPAKFIDALIAATAEMVRVLKPSGSIFVNLGDKYSGSAPGRRDKESMQKLDQRLGRLGASALDRTGPAPINRPTDGGIPTKSLMLLPERYRIAAVDRLGLTARAVIVWDKPNGLPESVCDRVRRSHEDWVHLTKQPHYFSAIAEIREPHQVAPHAPGNRGVVTAAMIRGRDAAKGISGQYAEPDRVWGNPLGKLPGSVWRIPTAPLTLPVELGVDHFAAFPPEWPKRIIQGWAPAGGVVLDPFSGTGTTAMAARALGRVGISVDLSHDYCRVAQWRMHDRAQMAKVRDEIFRKPVPQSEGQDSLFMFAAVAQGGKQ